jgi:hypothetical protein
MAGVVKKWENVRKQLTAGAMPPEGRPGPTAEELERVVDWIDQELQRAAVDGRGGPGRRPLRRLTRDEYSNTLRDLLGLRYAGFEVNLGERLPPEGLGAAFANDADALTIQPLHLQRFLETAERALDAVIATGQRPPVFKYEMDLAKLKPTRQKLGTTIEWEGSAHDPASNSTLKARAVLVEPVAGQGIQLGPVYSKENLEGPDGIRLLLTMPVVAPDSGVIRVQFRAHAVTPDGEGDPVLRLMLYYRDNNFVHIPLSSATVTHSPKRPGEYVFEIPIDFVEGTWDIVRRQKQMTLMITNAYVPVDDRDQARRPRKGEKWPWPEPMLVLHAVKVETPYHASWPPPAHKALLEAPGDAGEEGRARVVLGRFMRHAYRRPATGVEVERMLSLFRRARKQSPDFASAIKVPLTAVLCSPNFLCLVERKADRKAPVSDHELATRLSYFLWNTTPDDELLRLADAGRLSDPRALAAQVERLLKDRRSDAPVFLTKAAVGGSGGRAIRAGPFQRGARPGSGGLLPLARRTVPCRRAR